MTDDARELAMIRADDELLDRLGAGGPPPPSLEGDDVVAMLAAWRDDVTADAPPTIRRAIPVVRTSTDPRRAGRRRPSARRSSARRLSSRNRVLLAAAAALIALAGTVSVLASDARPDSPLWPVTRLLYADWANSVVAEQDAQRSIDEARQALDSSQYTDAVRLLDTAAALVDKVRDPSVAARLRDEIAALRALLPGVLPPPSTSAPAPPAPTTPGGGILPTGIVPPLPSLLPSLLPSPNPTCLVQLPPLLPPLPTCVL